MIAQASDNNCVLRGISTMRLALGYDNGLPSGEWSAGPREVWEVINLLDDLFPDHEVKVWSAKEPATKATFSKTVVYMGDDYKRRDDFDLYLWAFAYGPENFMDSESPHFVIGHLTLFPGMATSLLIGVKIT